MGFLLAVAIILQIFTGILLALHYTSDISTAYFSVFFLIREVYYGWCLRYFHSSGASFVFLFLFLHLGRAIFVGSYFHNPNTWFSGIVLLFLLMAIAFLGYVLPFGQMSFWGATVITNLLSLFPSLIEWVCGGYSVLSPTLKRFFVFHFILPFILCGFVILHLFYLHLHSSNNPLRINTNNKVPFFPFILVKDFFGLLVVLTLYFLQCHFGIATLSHPDNALEACALLTPLHIVPEWYFLCQYAMLIAIFSSIIFQGEKLFGTQSVLSSASSSLCIYHFVIALLGILLTFVPMHFLGFNLMPRRIPAFWHSEHIQITH
jgi:ubiquinol-cytochrome c reductase cytochrome b subunit